MTGPAAVGDVLDLAPLRRHVDVQQPVIGWNTTASPDAIRHFVAGYGDDSPHWGTAAADLHGGAVPPTFLYSVCSGGRADSLPGPAELLANSAAVWLGDAWEFHVPLRLDMQLSATVAIASVTPKVSRTFGPAVLVRERFEFRDGAGSLVATYVKTTMRFARRGEGAAGVPPVPEPVYTPGELDELASRVAAEADRRRGAQPRLASTVEVGQSLGSVLKGPLSLTSVIAWVAGWGSPYLQTDRPAHRRWLADPAQRLTLATTGRPESIEAPHWEPELSFVSGLPRGYDFGPQRIAWLVHLVTDWAGDHARVRSLDAEIKAPNLLGDLTTVTGTVTQRQGDDVVCEVTARNQRDETTARATVHITLPSEDDHERVHA